MFAKSHPQARGRSHRFPRAESGAHGYVSRHVTSSKSDVRVGRKPSLSGHGEVSFLYFLSTATPLPAGLKNMGTDNGDLSRPSTPPNPVPPGYFSASFERLIRENEMADWASAFTLVGEYCLI